MIENLNAWSGLIASFAPILIALITLIPTIISNRKKTQNSIEDLKTVVEKNRKDTREEMETYREETREHFDNIQKQLSNHIREDEDDNAKQTRTRILRFYDEMCEGKHHSESHFEDILDDIDSYERYSESHPDFKNSRGKVAMEYIRKTFHIVKANGGFLTHVDP